MAGGGTVLLTISFSVVIIKPYIVMNCKLLKILYTLSETIGRAD